MELLKRVEAFAKDSPDRPALVDQGGQRTTSYAQLWDLSGRIAGKLLAQGLRKGDAVVICLPRRMEYLACELGVFRAGGLAVPVIPDYPDERLDFIRGDCGARLLLTEDFLDGLDGFQPPPPVVHDPEDRALVIYTSGSTGRPKGIVFTVDVLDAPIRDNHSSAGMVEHVRFAAMAPLSFVAALGEYFNILAMGGCSYMIDAETRTDLAKLEDFYARHQLTMAFLPPRMLRVYRNRDEALEIMNTGSERLSGVFPEGYKVINNYGQTETGGTVCSFVVDGLYDATPIGKPKPGVTIRLLDDQGNEVSQGEEGEICAEGHFPHEYLNLPEQTARTFRRLDNGLVLVHTGDMGYQRPDGNYVYVNRKDWMVKINGQRVDPGEIESAIKDCPGVVNGAVKDFTHPSGQVYLCGYYVGDVSEDALRGHLTSRLAPYMVPAYLIALDAIPTNVNGKLDRSRLMPPDLSCFKAEYAAPENELQARMCAAFEELLRCGRVGLDDDFFLLGGDSIKVMQLQNMMNEPALTTEAVFQNRTPRAIAAAMGQAGPDLLGEALGEAREAWPLTPSQMGVYFACVRNPEGTMYNNPVVMEFQKSRFQLERVRQAAEAAINNHAVAGLELDASSGQPMMVAAGHRAELPVIQVSPEELERRLAGFVQPFAITGAPLYRGAVFDAGETFTLALDFHHLIFDGTSLSVILRELALGYEGEALPAETAPQTALGAWEEKLEDSGAARAAKDYYDRTLAVLDEPAGPVEDFPEDPALENKPSAMVTRHLDGVLSSSRVERACAALGVTPNALFLGAFQYAIAKFSGQDQVLVCAASHGRHDARLQNTVGMLVRTVPLFVQLGKEAEDQKVRDFLAQVQRLQRDVVANDCYPFVKLAADFGLAADIMFAYQSDAFNALRLEGETIPLRQIGVNSALSKLELMVFKAGEGYDLDLSYRADLYRAETAVSLLEMYAAILGEFLERETLREVTLCSEGQLSAVDGFNRTQWDYDRDSTVVDLFRAQAQRAPQAPAVEYGGRVLSYGELDRLTDALAGWLSAQGIGREDVVSVIIPRCEYMVIASLGILKAGAGYQPLDPTYPPERLNFMVKDAGARLLIADEELRGILDEYAGPVLLTRDIPGLPEPAALPEGPGPDDLFIMLYTSGSTGTPKGVMLEHGNLACFCDWYRRFYSLEPASHVAAYASYGFDACMMDLWPALTAGACVYIVPEAIRLDLMALGEFFERSGITHSFMTTQVGRMFATTVENHTLKFLSTGGETLAPLSPEEIPTGYALCNAYGPTECTIFATLYPMDRAQAPGRVPIGKALDNLKFYISDPQGRRLPVGAAGELCIAGHQVGRGYLNRPELTAFCSNPWSTQPGYERLYHTGDIVRLLPDGTVDFIGRRDGQVKIRGFRIELSEVEAVIRDFPGVQNAAVTAFDAPTGGKAIAAYVVADGPLDVDALNAFIAEKKPPYMVPAATVQMDAIPLNVNGKVDKRKLPAPEVRSEEPEAGSARPMTVLEEQLHAIVSKLIGREDFGVASGLLRLGLTSLSVIKLAVELKKAYGYEADVKELMEGCSVLSLENEIQRWLLERSLTGAGRDAAAQDGGSGHLDVCPLTAAQFGVYAECMRSPDSTVYNIPAALTFPAGTDGELLARAVETILLAHPYVFTHLTMEGTDVGQVYVADPQCRVPVQELSESEYLRMKEGYVQPFNLMKGPLFRVTVVKTEAAVHLLCDFHHIVFDGGSMDLFLDQLKTVLEGGRVEREEYSAFDRAFREDQARGGAEYQAAEDYFADMLKDCEAPSELSADVPGGDAGGAMALAHRDIDFDAAEAFCKTHGLTPAHLYLAATLYAVSRFTGSRGAYISTISNGRRDLKTAGCFGMFVRTLAVGCEVDDISALAFAEKARDVFAGAIDNELYPYAELCRSFSYAPHIVYEYQMGVTGALTVNGQPIPAQALGSDETKFKLAVHIELHQGRPAVVLQYDSALYSPALMDTLASAIAVTARAIVEKPEGAIRRVSMLTPEQAAQLAAFAVTRECEPACTLMHQAFERQAAAHPDREAIVAVDRTLTYAQLDALGNRAANALLARGLAKGGRVVLLLHRTSKVFAAILGVLKAGGAYIPTNPDYPRERIETIRSDSQARFLITEGELLEQYPDALDIDQLLAGDNDARPQVDISPEDLCYLIYTSGSTGKPKGVMIRHRGIANYVTDDPANLQVRLPVTLGSRYGSVTTLAFDMALKEVWVALSNGLTLVFAGEAQTTDPAALGRLFLENRVDVFNATPSRLLEYMAADEFAQAMANCRVILSGGEGYPNALLKLLREKTHARILNTYGPTEITVSSNAAELTDASVISIGRPLLNYREAIVDLDDNPLPVGVVGELLISGVGVAAGYNALPEQTAKAFITYDGRPTYRSGDYARWTADGCVVILGRKDNQVKLRGLRIELGEIERALTDLPGITRAVAAIRKLGREDAICAWYTAPAPMDEAEMKVELGRRLTDYMVPASLTFVETMPLTPNGKVNLKALPEPKAAERTEGRLPETETEKLLCSIYADILELDTVYADDSFFALGGSSLTVTRVVIAAGKAGKNISYGDVFDHPTPEGLAIFLDGETPKNEFADLGGYDYSAIDALLAQNTLDSFRAGPRRPLGTVLLTGAAGYLGIHILYELLHSYPGKVFCLLRGRGVRTAQTRLTGMFHYYFEEVLPEVFPDRVEAVEGDVTRPDSLEALRGRGIDTVINCAAIVKHFSTGTEIEDVNLGGAVNLIDFCRAENCRLIQVSTMSVGGMYVGKPGPVKALAENQLYVGQRQNSKYTQSKFLAERAVLQAASEGLDAKLMRVGTLAPRDRDGEYQINFATNNFMRRLKSTWITGCYPYEMAETPFELSPIDQVARAILLLAETPRENVVFHPYNDHTLMMGDLYARMDALGLTTRGVETAEYQAALNEAMADPEKASVLSGFIAYQNMAHGERAYGVDKSNPLTMQVLFRMGFRWPVTSEPYMDRFLTALRGLGFFD